MPNWLLQNKHFSISLKEGGKKPTKNNNIIKHLTLMTPLNVLALKLPQLSFKVCPWKSKWVEEQILSQLDYCKIRLRDHLHAD